MNPFNVLPRFENHFAIRTVRFQVQLEVDGYFSAQKFSHLQPPQAGRVGTNLQFLNPILQIQLQNTCWASPKPDVQHKNALVSHLNDRWISKFLGEKFVLWKSSLINLISHKTGTIASGFEGKKRKYHFLKNRAILWYALSRAVHKNRTSQVRFSPSKPDLIRPKTLVWLWYAFYSSSSNLENRMTVCMGYPAMTRRRAGKRRREGAGSPCRENGIQNLKLRWYAKPEPIVPIFALKFTSYFLKTGTTSS